MEKKNLGITLIFFGVILIIIDMELLWFLDYYSLAYFGIIINIVGGILLYHQSKSTFLQQEPEYKSCLYCGASVKGKFCSECGTPLD